MSVVLPAVIGLAVASGVAAFADYRKRNAPSVGSNPSSGNSSGNVTNGGTVIVGPALASGVIAAIANPKPVPTVPNAGVGYGPSVLNNGLLFPNHNGTTVPSEWLPSNIPHFGEANDLAKAYIADNYPGGYIKWLIDYYNFLPDSVPLNGVNLFYPGKTSGIDRYVKYKGPVHIVQVFPTSEWFEQLWDTPKQGAYSSAELRDLVLIKNTPHYLFYKDTTGDVLIANANDKILIHLDWGTGAGGGSRFVFEQKL